MLESTPAPAPTSPGEPHESAEGRPTAGSIARAVRFLPTRSGRRAALSGLVFLTLVAALVGGAILFHATGYRGGYRAGYESVGYYEAAAIADSMKSVAGNAVLESAGILPDRSQQGSWQLARFSLTPARELCSYGAARGVDTMVVATFTSRESVLAGNSYYSGSDGRIHHVNR